MVSQAAQTHLPPCCSFAELWLPCTQVQDAKRKAKEAQDELQASQYQSGSIAGKMLMNKCKELQEENDQLGKDLSEGRVQKLLADAALQKEYAREQKRALVETREWVEHLTDELDTSQVWLPHLHIPAVPPCLRTCCWFARRPL